MLINKHLELMQVLYDDSEFTFYITSLKMASLEHGAYVLPLI